MIFEFHKDYFGYCWLDGLRKCKSKSGEMVGVASEAQLPGSTIYTSSVNLGMLLNLSLSLFPHL